MLKDFSSNCQTNSGGKIIDIPGSITNKQLKKNLRQQILQTQAKTAIHEECIVNKVRRLLAKEKPKILGFYWPIRNEFNLIPMIQEWLTKHPSSVACLPAVRPNNLCLDFYSWQPKMQMEKGFFDIPVPCGHQKMPKQIPELLLIPCVGFDSNGFRLGYGGGYYDSTISEFKKKKEAKLLTVGIAFETGRLDYVPRESHDQPLDYIITNSY